jgi:type IV secretory pathway VirB9-like protein
MYRVLAAPVVCLLLWGCVKEPPPPEPAAPMPDDLSHYAPPALIQPPKPLPQVVVHKPTPAEKVYDFAPGGTYTIPVGLGAPLDIVFEPGEVLRDKAGVDPQPVAVQGEGEGSQGPWHWKEGMSGKDATAQPHLILRATQPGLELGLTIMTTRRVYYLVCKSVKTSPIRAVRWRYAEESDTPVPQETRIFPLPEEPRRYHVGYTITTSSPTPAFVPRFVVDDGTKLFLIYPEVTLFQSVPLVRAMTPQGPAILNSRQLANVVIIDQLVDGLELRLGTALKGDHADVVTITRGRLSTIECPGDAACPIWPRVAAGR